MMARRSASQLREDALAIWRAGVDAVSSERLVTKNVEVSGRKLRLADDTFDLDKLGKICVVGAGKAGAGMAAGLEHALGDALLAEKNVNGWVNVPADCVGSLERIQLHAARPAGINEPTAEGVRGCQEIVRLLGELGTDDLCICLLSGGGSALLPAPAPGITLEQKVAVTQHLSEAGANIQQLNTVRKQLSEVKGGGLARACRAGRMIALIISDVLGDPLEVIASGPTVADPTTPRDALKVLAEFPIPDPVLADAVRNCLKQRREQPESRQEAEARVSNYVIGNNAVAVDAAGMEAERRGYSYAMVTANKLEGAAEGIGVHLARMALQMREARGPDCLITGGEPTVKLAPASQRGLGGRNQQLVLAALQELNEASRARPGRSPVEGLTILAGGSDGEDGPTDAAGAWIDAEVAETARRRQLSVDDHLQRNDAYHFFESANGLIHTGPTHTNVCDIRVVVVDRVESSSGGTGLEW